VKDPKYPAAIGFYHTSNNQQILSPSIPSQEFIPKPPSATTAKNQMLSSQQIGHVFFVVSMTVCGFGKLKFLIGQPHVPKLYCVQRAYKRLPPSE